MLATSGGPSGADNNETARPLNSPEARFPRPERAHQFGWRAAHHCSMLPPLQGCRAPGDRQWAGLGPP